jgi:hypothetical protein
VDESLKAFGKLLINEERLSVEWRTKLSVRPPIFKTRPVMIAFRKTAVCNRFVINGMTSAGLSQLRLSSPTRIPSNSFR